MKKFGIAALLMLGLVAAGAFAYQGGMRDGTCTGDGPRMGNQNQRIGGQGMANGNNAELRLAVEAEDYEAWQEAISSMDYAPRIADVVLTEDDFNLLVQLHEARESGDMEAAQKLKDELGIGWQQRGRN